MSIDAVLACARIPGAPHVVALGCWERSVSIFLQQVRALNLVYALHATGQFDRTHRIGVFGGGFAGMTAAAALHQLGYGVTLLEQQPQLLHWQQGNRTRHIHPHLHEWPRPGSEEPDAGLPLLNWQADVAGDVATHLVRQFEALQVPLELSVVDASLDAYDRVILALGLGVERSFGSLPLNSYWTDDSVSTIHDGSPQRYLVSGIGEGGVIDSLYLRLREFSHAVVVRDVLSGPDMLSLKADLLHLEDSAADNLTARYEALQTPSCVDRLLADRLRSDTVVTLNGNTAQYLSPKADILNRLLLSRLVRMGAIRYLPGKLTIVTPVDGRYVVQFDTGSQQDVDRVLIRHGTVPSMQVQFPLLWEPYLAMRRTLPSTPEAPVWPPDFDWRPR